MLRELLKDIADAIRLKKNTTEKIKAIDFPQEILSIKGELSTEAYMRLWDLAKKLSTNPSRVITEKDYTLSEVNKVQELINKLGVMDNG